LFPCLKHPHISRGSLTPSPGQLICLKPSGPSSSTCASGSHPQGPICWALLKPGGPPIKVSTSKCTCRVSLSRPRLIGMCLDGDQLLTTGDYHYRRGFLIDNEVDDWIHQRGNFAAPTYSAISKNHSGELCYIRLLMCERIGWWPPTFTMSQNSFTGMEREFALSRATLPLLCRDSGLEYSRLLFNDQAGKQKTMPSVCELNNSAHELLVGRSGG
jgi:hypothetical protein